MNLVPVKKSTLATWCRDVKLTEEQIEAIRERRPSAQRGIPRDTQRKRRRVVELIRSQATLEAEHLVDDPLWTAGVAMYWGEGSKTIRRLSMANSDPAVLRMFMNWTETYLPPKTAWRAKINLHANNDELGARTWWAGQLGLTLDDFTKSYVKPEGTGHRKNHLPFGVCILTKRRSSDAHLTTMAWVEFLQEHFGH